ncbi:MAG: hypothetical protein M3Y28_05660 [Armatimonadota bacterium]|nr:hypothetical protein [Armatimonadota bacterium]
MTKRTLGFTLATALLVPTLAHAQIPAAAPITAPTAAKAPKRNARQVQGKVSAVDTTKRTITVTTRRDPVGVTVTLAPDAKINTQKPAMLADLKTGDKVTVYGRNITAGATTVQATRLLLFPVNAARVGKKKPGPQAGFHKTSIEGAVATTAPTLTITTPGGITVSVQTTPDTKVAQTAPGVLSDITVGTTVQIRTNGDATAPTGTEVSVMPANANANRRTGGKKRTRKQTPVTTPAVP